jgi:hypothetical protein
MAEKVSDGVDVGSGFEEMGGEGMAERVAGDAFVEWVRADGVAKLAGHGVGLEVVTSEAAGAWMGQHRRLVGIAKRRGGWTGRERGRRRWCVPGNGCHGPWSMIPPSGRNSRVRRV